MFYQILFTAFNALKNWEHLIKVTSNMLFSFNNFTNSPYFLIFEIQNSRFGLVYTSLGKKS